MVLIPMPPGNSCPFVLVGVKPRLFVGFRILGAAYLLVLLVHECLLIVGYINPTADFSLQGAFHLRQAAHGAMTVRLAKCGAPRACEADLPNQRKTKKE